MNLTADDFPSFYKALHCYPPFPWQSRLVKEIVESREGRWPPVLNLPPSSGKTSVIDMAVFLLALEADKPIAERRAAMRTFFVVDRRIIVDEAGEHAKQIAHSLNNLSADADPVVQTVADRLRRFGGDKALHVSVLRGGMYRDGSWAQAPNQPTICLSTVDQVGSRLLFRGYGVSEYQRAVHAGLVGNDSLIIVDEAHLWRPFRETLKAVQLYRGDRWAEQPIRTPFQVVFMSATVQGEEEPFELSAEDKANEVLGKRLQASKRARLREVKVEDDEETARRTFAQAVADAAVELAGLHGQAETTGRAKRGGKKKGTDMPPANVIGVVVNRVETARRVFELLKERVRKLLSIPAGQEDQAVILLTGRIRPYDRDELLFRRPISEEKGWLKFLVAKASADQEVYARPAPPLGKLFVVATQTIEVGANLSFDALVTEAAPLDALRQRFGRLDRLGLRRQSDAVILARKDHLAKHYEDWVYGSAIRATWDWLEKQATGPKKDRGIDFGVEVLRLPANADELEQLCAQADSAPVMLPAHVDTWVQTTPTPVPDADVSLFLHGPAGGPADVNVIWRGDLEWEGTNGERVNLLEDDEEAAIKVVSLVPPTSMEAMPVPIGAVKKWLRNNLDSDFADQEGARSNDEGASRGRPCLRWFGPDSEETTRAYADDIQPGDTIIVPSSYGGADQFGWNPGEKKPVIDVADDCSWRVRRRPVLRIHFPSRVHEHVLGGEQGNHAAWKDDLPEGFGARLVERLAALLEEAEPGELDWKQLDDLWGGLPDCFRWMSRSPHLLYPDGAGPGVVLVARKPFKHPSEAGEEEDAPLPGDGSSLIATAQQVSLAEHCEGVREQVERFAQGVCLDEQFTRILSRAAQLHDAGKADDRFQLWLHGADEREWLNAGGPLAKSQRLDVRNRAASEAARRRAGWPKGARHEALSVLLLQDCPAALERLQEEERDLLLYLVGTHHGRGRPFWSVAEEDDVGSREIPEFVACRLAGYELRTRADYRPELTPALAALHSGWIDRFWRLIRRYGYWGLAYLETLLVLADHRQSRQEREGGKTHE
ncbi:MAG TPA: type I-U CRISPR-associated helicase/endonuclease Cas3 [Gemmataceae bacterium]|nr:type I-U CRISPR-associated helicase/endonuclease Cas3 [Gemmataceae bacterium]